MLIECKNDKEKVAMGLLSYLPDFKNLANLKDEIHLNKNSNEFHLYLYRAQDPNFVGVIGTAIFRLLLIIVRKSMWHKQSMNWPRLIRKKLLLLFLNILN